MASATKVEQVECCDGEQGGGSESCQGPHPWRKKLKPIRQSDNQDHVDSDSPAPDRVRVRRLSVDEKTKDKIKSGVKREPSFGKSKGVMNQHVAPGRSTGESMGTKKRVEKVLKARLYLLQQTGPNSFLIGGDSPDHKYRVIIGPQRCSCGRGPQCVHVLFVMLRVFQLNESDPCFWSASLKNYEVETLFRTFHERRSSLLQNLSKKKPKHENEVKTEESEKKEEETPPCHSSESTDHENEAEGKDEEATCPICLLEMVEGESLTECVNGCGNKLHHHCIAVWFEECRRQNEPLICPLCRAKWKVDNESLLGRDELAAPPNTRASSPQNVPQQGDIMLPHADPIPPEHEATATPWIPVLGEELVACLFSKNWMVREIALKQLGRVAIGALLLGVGEGRSGVMVSPTRQATTRAMLECCCSVLAYMCADPVYKVFVAGLRTLRTVLAYTPCRDETQQARLQTLLKPVIDTILWKCADSNKRTSQLSISGLQELVKGQDGELAVGKEIVNPGHFSVGSISFLLDCIAQKYDQNVQWQWLLGRFFMLLKLLEEYPTDFVIQPPVSKDQESLQSVPPEKYLHYNRIMTVLTFTKPALDNSHQKVSRTARKVFYWIARLQAHHAGVLKCVMDMLEGLSLDLQVHLKRRLLRMAAEFNMAQHVMNAMQPGDDDDDPLPLFTTPILSGTCSPRSESPSPHISVTVNNFVSGNVNFMPVGRMAPPNSPARRRPPVGKSNNTSVCTQEGEETPDGASTNAGSSHPTTAASTPFKIPNNTLVDTPNLSVTSSPVACKAGSERVLVDACISTSPMLAIRGLPSGCSEVDDISGSTEDLNLTSHTADADTQTDDELEKTDDELDKTDDEVKTDEEEQMKPGCDTPSTQDNVSISSANATAASSSGLTEDLTDLTLSSGTEHVSFKTEVANASPQRSHTCRTLPKPSHSDNCHCKEEVELEEAQALVEALEQSSLDQNALPFVPGLSRKDETDTFTIHIQDEQVSDPAHSYLEDVNWKRGMMLGTGGFSTCYQAWDFKTGTIMCVKQISFCRNSQSEQDNVVDAIREEIQMMSRINHPNIVRILGATQQGCHFFMFVEWMPGGSVSLLLDRFGAFEEPVLVNYTQQTLRGLAYLHDCQVLHRDLKGANLLVDSTGKRLRIGDFGAAARLASRTTMAGEFQGQLLGTIAFMAPEVLRGENYGRSCDVWSVGCTMIEMATTKPPWGASGISNHLALIFKIASSQQPPPIPDNLSPPVRDLLLRCLETERADRPPAKELLKHPLFTMFPKH